MIVTVDRVGRIVIPKPMRVALGIGPDTEMELVTDGTALRLEPIVWKGRTVHHQDGVPILSDVPGATLTDAEVRRLRDDDQR